MSSRTDITPFMKNGIKVTYHYGKDYYQVSLEQMEKKEEKQSVK